MNFSVAMTTYNGARFLYAQLESFAQQTVLPSELVVCDDGSTDDTRRLLEEFAARAPFPVRLEFNARRLGVSDNSFRAASLCRHEWIAFSDQDDVWLPEKLATVRDVVAHHPGVLLTAHRALIVNERSESTGRLLEVPSARRLLVVPARGERIWHPPLGFTICFDARLVRQFPFENRPIVTHDRWVYVVATSLGSVAYLPQVLALYRRHDSNVSQFTPRVPLMDDVRGLAVLTNLAEHAEVTDQIGRYFERCRDLDTSDFQSELPRAIALFLRQSGFYAARARMCSPGLRMAERLSRFLRVLVEGGYRAHRSGGVGWRAGMKDGARVLLAR